MAKLAWAGITTLVTGLLSHMAGLMIGSRKKCTLGARVPREYNLHSNRPAGLSAWAQ